MTSGIAMFLFAVGFFLTAFGVGGIEQSITEAAMLTGCLVSALGLAVMCCGVLGLQTADSYE